MDFWKRARQAVANFIAANSDKYLPRQTHQTLQRAYKSLENKLQGAYAIQAAAEQAHDETLAEARELEQAMAFYQASLSQAYAELESSQRELKLARGLTSHLKYTRNNLIRAGREILGSIIEHPVLSHLAVAIADKSQEISYYASTRKKFIRRLKGEHFSDLGINPDKEFQRIEIGNRTYAVHLTPIKVRGEVLNYLLTLMRDTGEKPKKAFAKQAQIIESKMRRLLTQAAQTAVEAKEKLRERLESKGPGLSSNS
jgi:hypothetical protein